MLLYPDQRGPAPQLGRESGVDDLPVLRGGLRSARCGAIDVVAVPLGNPAADPLLANQLDRAGVVKLEY